MLNPRVKAVAPTPSLPVHTLQPVHIKHWERVLEQCQTELNTGIMNIQQLSQLANKNTVIQSPKFDTYIRGLLEIYRVAKRINSSTDYFGPQLMTGSFSISLETIFLLEQIKTTFQSLQMNLKNLSLNVTLNLFS